MLLLEGLHRGMAEHQGLLAVGGWRLAVANIQDDQLHGR